MWRNNYTIIHWKEKNVWTSDKSWEPGSFLMFSYVFQCFLTFSIVTYSHSHSLSLSHSLTLSHSHTHWITLDMLNNFCFHVHAQKSLSHSLSLFLTLTLFQSLIQSLLTCWTSFVFISMLKSRCLNAKIAMFFFLMQFAFSQKTTLYLSLKMSRQTKSCCDTDSREKL